MAEVNTHWTAQSYDDFVYRIASDFVQQLEKLMESGSIKQADLAKTLGVTPGRVSQVLSNPGNLSLKKIVEYARALGQKVALVAYDDGDAENTKGPINAEIFSACWKKAGSPSDFFALQESTETVQFVIGPAVNYIRTPINPVLHVATGQAQSVLECKDVAGTEGHVSIAMAGAVTNG
jgi:transcriptional regulator with XRE-family HTH domain